MTIRKIIVHEETVYRESRFTSDPPVKRVAGIALVANPFVGQTVEDLSVLFETGGQIGDRLMPELAGRLSRPATSYGKAALVGARGDFEHGAASVHPMLGKPMRAALGGGKALIPSNVKVGPPGATIDVPLGHKDDPWSFDHFDTLSLCIPDSPRPDEIMIVVAIADGGRIHPRCGSAPIT